MLCSSLVAHVYPAFRTYQTIQHPGRADEARRWLMYWVVLGAFHTVEGVADSFIWWYGVGLFRAAAPITMQTLLFAGCPFTMRSRLCCWPLWPCPPARYAKLSLPRLALISAQGAQHLYGVFVQPLLRANEERIESSVGTWLGRVSGRVGANLQESLNRVNEYLQQLAQMPTPTTPNPAPTATNNGASDFEDIASSASDALRKNKQH